MTTAFVLSGGENRGGHPQGLHERHIVPDLLVGTSVGALTPPHLAAGIPGDEQLARDARRSAAASRAVPAVHRHQHGHGRPIPAADEPPPRAA